MGDAEVSANLYCYFAYLYWEGCVICSTNIFAVSSGSPSKPGDTFRSSEEIDTYGHKTNRQIDIQTDKLLVTKMDKQKKHERKSFYMMKTEFKVNTERKKMRENTEAKTKFYAHFSIFLT